MQIYIDKIKSPINRLIVSFTLSFLLAVQFVGALRPVTTFLFVMSDFAFCPMSRHSAMTFI